MNRAYDWLKQAKKDLEHAKKSFELKDYEWSCFASHQSAEKAVKALHLFFGQEAWGHVISKLLKELPCDVSEDIVEIGKALDIYYIPTRYPNGFESGAPFEHFGKLQAKEAIKFASEIIEFVSSKMAR